MVIANALSDGLVVFLAQDDAWVNAIGDARVAHNDAEADAMLATAKEAERRNEVIDPYLIDVLVAADGPRPLEYREFIRATGPTV